MMYYIEGKEVLCQGTIWLPGQQGLPTPALKTDLADVIVTVCSKCKSVSHFKNSILRSFL